MAGHSKWANIKHRKGAQDKKRAKVFTRILKEIHIAVKELDNPDPETNPKLRLAIQNAKGANIPKDNIERAIKKAAGADSGNYEEVHFEGYLPYGIAVIIEASTDNHQRTVANVRAVFNKTGGSLGTHGSLDFLFDRKGVFHLSTELWQGRDLEALELALIEGGAEEIEKLEEERALITSFEDYGRMQAQLEKLDLEPSSSELLRFAKTEVELEPEKRTEILRAIDLFEADDDVNNVFYNISLNE